MDPLPLADVEEPRERADAQRNRIKVLDAAARLFAQEGVENVSMEQIAAAAGVGKGTLFRRFGDRAGLAQALLEEKTVAFQEACIRGPAQLGPGAAPRDRLLAFAGCYLDLLADRAELMAAGELTGRLDSAPYAFQRTHVGVLVREAAPDADWELLADMLLAPFAAETYLYWTRVRGFDHARILASYETLVTRVLP